MSKLYKYVSCFSIVRNIITKVQRKILIGILFTSSILIGQNSLTKSDSIYFENRIYELSKSITELNQYTKNTFTTNDSLKKELQYYRIKEDYYSDALGDQATRFSLIIASLLALAGFVSWGGFKLQLDRIKTNAKNQLKTQESEFEKFKSTANRLDANIFTATANTFVIHANNCRIQLKFVEELEFRIWAAGYYGLAYSKYVQKSNDQKLIEDKLSKLISYIKEIKDPLEEVLKNDDSKDSMKMKLDFLINELDSLNKIESQEIKDLVAEFRFRIKDYSK